MRRRKRRFYWWWLLLAAAIILIIYLAIPKPPTVRTVPVRQGFLALFLSTTGVVEGQVSDVSAEITARITTLYAEEGDRATAGQVLAQLESADLSARVDEATAAVRAAEEDVAALTRSAEAESGQLRAAVAQARANLETARQNLRQVEAGPRSEEIASQRAAVAEARALAEDARVRLSRAQRLYERGAIAAQDVDTARTNYDTARARLESAEQVLARLRAGSRAEEIAAARAQVLAAQSALESAQSALGIGPARAREVAAARARLAAAEAALRSAQAQFEYTIIRSPVAGVVARRHREIGETITPGMPIYTVANLSKIWVAAEVAEEDVAAVAAGQPVTITLDAYPGRAASGVVAQVSRIAEPKDVGRVRAKVVRARIDIRSSDIPLRPGMEVTITGSLPVGRSTLLVPNDAVVRVGEEDSVYVIEGGVARRRRVQIGQSNLEETQVLSGLTGLEEVAVTNLGRLRDGMRVRVVD
ncbi:MAG: efflux RND transporter periplasmic adaptor subunit [Armatimonadota bacterium]